MTTRRRWTGFALAAGLLVTFACSESSNPVAIQETEGLRAAGRPTAEGPTRVAAIVDGINARLEAAGSDMRLVEGWFFSVGPGTDPYRRLRTGARWTVDEVFYMLDESDYTTDVPAVDVESALVSAYETWNDVRQTSIEATRVPDDGGNHDVLDATVYEDGECVDILDTSSPNVVGDFIFPYADIVVGGWLAPAYFEDCLGSANIIGVTWSFSGGDSDSDNYTDRLYVEQYYNTNFEWVTSGSTFLDYSTGFDIESIAVHEDGHTHGVGHFGGPNAREPFKLQPNGKVFDPTAVMNPFYLGGEKRDLYPTDVAALRTMYVP